VWRIEYSDDGEEWVVVAFFNSADVAMRVFDMEMAFERFKYIRLVSPDDTIQERAMVKAPIQKIVIVDLYEHAKCPECGRKLSDQDVGPIERPEPCPRCGKR
jgi:tRNA(Ile2) C34 agmatinyltransferase TiaS